MHFIILRSAPQVACIVLIFVRGRGAQTPTLPGKANNNGQQEDDNLV